MKGHPMFTQSALQELTTAVPTPTKHYRWTGGRVFTFLLHAALKNNYFRGSGKVCPKAQYALSTIYRGSSSGSHPSNSFKQKKHLTRSGSWSVGQW